MRTRQTRTVPNRILRFCFALVTMLACFYLVRTAARTGLSRLYSASVTKGLMLPGTDAEQLEAIAEESIRLGPSDPEAFRARATADVALNQPADAAEVFAHAITLRPRHYLLRMDLGFALDQAGETEGAIQAFREAVRLAPYFAQPRWQLANVLFRAGRYDEAFPELSRAITRDSTLLPLSMELVWIGSRGDVQKFKEVINPTEPSQRLIVGRFLAKHGKAREAVEMFHATGGIDKSDQKALVKELMATKHFAAAYEVWSSGRAGLDVDNRGFATLTDPGFENNITIDDPGFGWQVNSGVPTFKAALETTVRHEGSRSLRVEWTGDSNPITQLITQVVLVEPNRNYRLSFSALGKGVMSGGLPAIVISDASSSEYKILGKAAVIADSEQDWKSYEIEFKSEEKTEAILISLQRQPCASQPCPIFGRVWLDSFLLKVG